MNRKRNRGVTILELFVSLGIFSLILTIGVSGFRAFFSRMEVANGVNTVPSAFGRGRYESIQRNKRVKVSMEEFEIRLMEKKDGQWEVFHRFTLDKKVSFTMNAFPVFSPYGSVSPLCSVYVENEAYRYKITISMAGRIKVVRLK
ncbi:MAG: hypothetical protein GY940_18240 [bacterium]|nr:hypothetical protein [bacterium]